MKRNLFIAAIACLAVASCKKEPLPMSRQEMQHKIDSLTQVRIHESDEQARRDLLDRIKIEVKVKVDSIVNARLHPMSKDSVTRPDIPNNKKGIVPQIHLPMKPAAENISVNHHL